MSNLKEKTYGSKLRNAQSLVNKVATYSNFSPSRTEIQVATMIPFLNQLSDINAQLATLEGQYHTAVAERIKLYKSKTEFITIYNLVSRIDAGVRSSYGKKSTEYLQVNSLIVNMRKTQKITKEVMDEVTGVTSTKTISQSKQSYGSTLQYFSDIVNSLSNYSQYQPIAPELQLANLQNFIQTVATANDTVDISESNWKTQIAVRQELFADLEARVMAIKDDVRSNYGNKSREYELIRIL